MFIYSIKRPRELDNLRGSLVEEQKKPEYYRYDPLNNFQQNSPLHSQLQPHYAKKVTRKEILKKYESIVYTNETDSGIHTYRRKLQLAEDYTQSSKILRTDQGSVSPPLQKNTLSMRRIKHDQSYFNPVRIQAERYFNGLQPRILCTANDQSQEMSQHRTEPSKDSGMQRQLKTIVQNNLYDKQRNLIDLQVLETDKLILTTIRLRASEYLVLVARVLIQDQMNVHGPNVGNWSYLHLNCNFEVKVNIYMDFINVLNMSNEIIVVPSSTPYRAIITKANNGMVVRQCLRQRWWWTLCEKDEPLEKVNMLWSSWKKPKFVRLLKTAAPKGKKDAPVSQYLNGDMQYPQAKQQHMRFGKWRFLKRLLNEKQISDVYDGQAKSHPKGLSGVQGPFVFDQFDKNPSALLGDLMPWLEFPQFVPSVNWKLHNHLERNSTLHSKKHLLHNLTFYYKSLNLNPFDFIPLTFHISQGHVDKEFIIFRDVFKRLKGESDLFNVDIIIYIKKNSGLVWIVKPGENSNRGFGIQVYSKLSDIQSAISQKEYHSNGKRFTYIVQKYIEKPMLFNKRKFDIRCYILMTSVNGRIKAYWFKDGYVRTSSKEYSLRNLENRLIHLTNDAIQKKSEEYGKFEYGNKISLEDFQRYLTKQNLEIDFNAEIFPRMRLMALDSVKSVFHKIDPSKRINTFELFGLDFMLDEDIKPWLIEFNANPCLEISCSVLNRIIPSLIENVWKVAIDPLFPPPYLWPKNKRSYVPENIYGQNKFELIFDEFFDGVTLKSLMNIEPPPTEEFSEDDVCDDD